MKNTNKSDREARHMPLGMCLGIAVGTAVGVALDNLSVYMPVGLAIGMCIGAFIDGKNRKDTGESTDTEDKES